MAPRNSEGTRRAPWEGLAGAAPGLSARALPSLAAATLSALSGGSLWVTGGLADCRWLTSQGEAQTFRNCPLRAQVLGPGAPLVLLLEKRAGKRGKEDKARTSCPAAEV